ncbi:hypothetical protein ACLK18_11925 [Escherichia coli]
MPDSIGRAAKAMAENLTELHVVDVGWPGPHRYLGVRKSRWWRSRLRFWLTWRCTDPYDAGGKC